MPAPGSDAKKETGASGKRRSEQITPYDETKSEATKDWLHQIYSLMEKKPAEELFSKLKRNVTVCFLNFCPKIRAIKWAVNS